MNPQDIQVVLEHQRDEWNNIRGCQVQVRHLPTGLHSTAQANTPQEARRAAMQGLQRMLEPKTPCHSPYCECPHDQCAEGKLDGRGQVAEDYDGKVIEDTIRDLRQTTQQAKERAVLKWADEQKIQYMLDKLQEEAAEVIQAVSKIRRFGPHNHHPDRTQTNLEELVGELEDFQAIVLALEELQYLDPKPSTIQTIKKFNTIMG